MLGDDRNAPVPMNLVIAKELEILGSHGMPAHDYGDVFDLILNGSLDLKRLVHKTIGLAEAPNEFEAMGKFNTLGATVIDRF